MSSKYSPFLLTVLAAAIPVLGQSTLIEGKVVDPYGAPVAGVAVTLYAKQPQSDGSWLLRSAGMSAPTSSDGSFSIRHYQQGRFYLLANIPDEQKRAIERAVLTRQKLDEQLVPTFFPDTTEFSNATAIVLKSAPVRDVTIRLQRRPLYSIRGKLVLSKSIPKGALVRGLTIVSEDSGLDLPSYSVVMGAEGDFEIKPVPPGRYWIELKPTTLEGGRSVTVSDQDVENVELRVARGAVIDGTLRYSGDAPGDGNRSPRVRISSTVPVEHSLASTPSPNIGSFQILAIDTGRYRVTVEGLLPPYYVQSVHLDGKDLAEGEFVADVEEVHTMEVLIGSDAATVTARVADGTLRQPQFVIWNTRGSLEFSRLRPYFSNEGFEIPGVPPGNYFIAAWERVPDPMLVTRELLAQFEGHAARISLLPKARMNLVVPIIPSDVLETAMEMLP